MAATIDEVVARARADDIRLVRFLYCDPSGVIRGKNVHVDRLAGKMRELLGPEQQAHFLEDWRAMTVVLDKGELRPGRYRGRKPA